MPAFVDGPASPLFRPLVFSCVNDAKSPLEEFRKAAKCAPLGDCVAWGIPFTIERPRFVANDPMVIDIAPTTAPWLVIAHAADVIAMELDERGYPLSRSGSGFLGEPVARYTFLFEDGEETSVDLRLRFQLGMYRANWGESCFEAVSFSKTKPSPAHHEQMQQSWGPSQTRVVYGGDGAPWVNWLWAWENPTPEKAVRGVKITPIRGAIAISAITAGNVESYPLRWQRRQKAIFTLPEAATFSPTLDENGLLSQIQLDMGQVISATPRRIYPNDTWASTPENTMPEMSEREVIVEYTAHPAAHFHLEDGARMPAATLPAMEDAAPLRAIASSTQRVNLRVTLAGSNSPVPVKLHVHGEAGEYLAPVDRHRIINTAWFEDYSVDYSHWGRHHCTYISGETRIDLPLGRVYIEITKGFEIRPIRRVYDITPATEEIVIELDKVLPWRERGWVTADTHVHFLSPISALLEGAAEGVNVVNLLASQWGELMTNVGDFDGRSTFGSREAGGDGEYLVRVGTENRQRVLGHISLLGYNGNIIAPMTSGGPDESALGDPVEALLTEWARQCKEQQGVVVLPHFPSPRAEFAAAMVENVVDGVEMTAWSERYAGINPYSLADWYRYLNCGYMTAAVAGTDKMTAQIAVGTIRTYALLDPASPFTYEAWKEAIRRARTFVSYGPLMEFSVDGYLPGERIILDASGGTVDVHWRAASVTMPMTSVDLIVNGEVRESRAIAPGEDAGQWSVKIDSSSWIALLVRGQYPEKKEIIAAHSSPVMAEVAGSPFFAPADAVAILEQIEGSLAFVDTLGTRADTLVYKRMRLALTSAHRSLHNRLHEQGHMHLHTPSTDHPEHHHD